NKENAAIALDTCQDFVKTFQRTNDNLLLLGDTGVGKTYLSHCIAGALLKQSYSVVYLTASEFFDEMAKTRFDKKEDNGHIRDCDLLIIDDLGTELSNTFTNTEFFIVINDRLLRKKSTLISTNLSLEDIKTIYTERVFSRLTSNYTMLRLTGEDIRIKKKLRF
ncbi:MAG TPA: ATP-binding protein, partial [Candidatus Dorea intestinavium]|nr:ATP-binding protein [Candidatus Dorea intestinavium]